VRCMRRRAVRVAACADKQYKKNPAQACLRGVFYEIAEHVLLAIGAFLRTNGPTNKVVILVVFIAPQRPA